MGKTQKKQDDQSGEKNRNENMQRPREKRGSANPPRKSMKREQQQTNPDRETSSANAEE